MPRGTLTTSAATLYHQPSSTTSCKHSPVPNLLSFARPPPRNFAPSPSVSMAIVYDFVYEVPSCVEDFFDRGDACEHVLCNTHSNKPHCPVCNPANNQLDVLTNMV